MGGRSTPRLRAAATEPKWRDCGLRSERASMSSPAPTASRRWQSEAAYSESHHGLKQLLSSEQLNLCIAALFRFSPVARDTVQPTVDQQRADCGTSSIKIKHLQSRSEGCMMHEIVGAVRFP